MGELDKILITTYRDQILDECPKLIAGNEVDSKISVHLTTHASINVVINPFVHSFVHLELNLMYRLMDRIAGGVDPMLGYLEAHIISTGLADMKAHAETITSVSISGCVQWVWLDYLYLGLREVY